ncbi:MAG: hypothetical protein ACJAV1_001813 [Paraglaciecola sp.]|jgi:hypothetical protein
MLASLLRSACAILATGHPSLHNNTALILSLSRLSRAFVCRASRADFYSGVKEILIICKVRS